MSTTAEYMVLVVSNDDDVSALLSLVAVKMTEQKAAITSDTDEALRILAESKPTLVIVLDSVGFDECLRISEAVRKAAQHRPIRLAFVTAIMNERKHRQLQDRADPYFRLPEEFGPLVDYFSYLIPYQTSA